MNALLLGATGLIGRETLALLRADPAFSRVLVLARRDGPSDAKVEWRTVDFDAPETYTRLAAEPVDVVFSCLGTTRKQAGNQEVYRRVDHTYPMRVVDALRPRADRVRFFLVTSIGAAVTSPSPYLRLKGELERDVAGAGFRSVEVFQPSMLLGAREGERSREATYGAWMSAFGFLMVGPLSAYHPIEGAQVARAMVACAKREPTGVLTVHRYREMA